MIFSNDELKVLASIAGVSVDELAEPTDEQKATVQKKLENAVSRVLVAEHSEQRDTELLGERERHPAYGMVSLTNTKKRSERLFQSSVRPDRTVTLSISQASVSNNLGEDFLFSEDMLVEVEMTSAQFADMISSMNTQGSACTITRTGGHPVEPPPSRMSPTERHKVDFKKKVARMTESLHVLRDDANEKLRGKGALRVADRKQIARTIDLLIQDLESNLPFISEQFDRSMQQAMHDYTSAVRAFSSDLMSRSNASLEDLPEMRMLESGDRSKSD